MTPHLHLCEIKMINVNFKKNIWKKDCPYKGNLSEDEHECDLCDHMVIVEFEDENCTKIKNIIR